MSYELTGKIPHNSGLMSKQQKINEWKNRNRRKVMPGYPIEKVFQTKEEIDLYLSGDKIICLLCGRSFKSLCSHLGIHGTNVEAYKEQYGLPYLRGLSGENTSRLIRENALKMLETGIWQPPNEEQLKYMQSKAKNQRFQPFRKSVSITNVSKTKLISKRNLKFNREKSTYEYWTNDDYFNILELAKKEQLHPYDIIDKYHHQIPSISQYRIFRKENVDFALKEYDLVCALPYEVQAKHSFLPKNKFFVDEIARLKGLNKTHKEIGALFNLHEVTIEKYVKKHGLKKPFKTHCINGHPYINGLRRCQICNTNHQRKRFNSLPREIARITEVIKNCFKCGKEVLAKKLGRPFCENCKRDAYIASQEKYRVNNLEKRKKMAKINYEKNKIKQFNGNKNE